ncbi:cytochrome P450 [Peniophora sp. CONT]|nr:cytochrome P450 [Peniophora sp. CONT]
MCRIHRIPDTSRPKLVSPPVNSNTCSAWASRLLRREGLLPGSGKKAAKPGSAKASLVYTSVYLQTLELNIIRVDLSRSHCIQAVTPRPQKLSRDSLNPSFLSSQTAVLNIHDHIMPLILDLPAAVFVCVNVILLVAFLSRHFHRPSGTPVVSWAFPIIGHALPFVLAPTQFLAWCRARTGPVFKLILPGQNMVVVSDPMAIVFLQTRSQKELGPFDYQAIGPLSGIPDARVPAIFHVLHHKVYTLAASSLSSKNLGDLAADTVGRAIAALKSISMDTQSLVDINMSDLVSRVLFRASSATFWGEQMPDVLTDFLAFDRDMFFIAGRIPFGGRSGVQARERLVLVMRTFLAECWSDDENACLRGASPFMSNTIRALKQSNLSDDEVARTLIVLLWGFHSNVIQVSVWLMAYLTANPYAFIKVRDGVRAVYPDAEPDVDVLSRHFREVPILDSAIKEVMRMTLLPTSARVALADVVLPSEDGCTHTVRKGERIIVDVRGLHHDPRYHKNPTSFQADRFLDSEARYGNHGGLKTLVPWGGGMFMCKGREYAQRVIKAYFIIFFQLYDVGLWGYQLPSHDNWSASVAHPNSCPPVRLRRRE